MYIFFGHIWQKFKYQKPQKKHAQKIWAEYLDPQTYHNNYKDNRGSNCYLPADMSIKDDPWRNFKL